METQIKTYKYKIECKNKSINEMKNLLYICRNLYNAGLEERIKSYPIIKRNGGKQITGFDQKRDITHIREYWTDMDKYPSCIYQECILNLDKTFKAFFNRCKKGDTPGFPKFKSSKTYKTVTLTYAGGWYIGNESSQKLNKHTPDQVINHNILKVNGIGRLKLLAYKKYPIIGKVKQLELTLEGDTLWASITAECYKPEPMAKNGEIVGLDVGINYLVSDSDKLQWQNQKLSRKNEDRMTELQQKLSNAKQWGKNWYKINAQINKLYKKIANSKKHYYRIIAKHYATKYDLVAMEELKIKNMSASASGTIEEPGKNVAQKSGLNRSIIDASWYMLRVLIEQKCNEYGKQFVLVNPKFTSQKCSACGEVVKKSLSVRTHVCKCGYSEDRDINAANNILYLALVS